MNFKTIDPSEHLEEVIKFRRDSFIVSFGNAADFDAENYLQWLKENTILFPDGFVLAEEDGERIGQLELSIREYESRNIGYVHLYYLLPDYRGLGKGRKLHYYAIQFFKKQNVGEFHLRVAPTNITALRFYQRLGMEEIGPEVEGKVIRMKGFL